MFRVALLGAWNPFHASEFCRNLSKISNVSVAGIYDRKLKRAEELAVDLETSVLPTLEQALEQSDGVILNADPCENAPLALSAMQAGRHILADKIVAVDGLQRDSLRHAAAQYDGIFCTAYPLTGRAVVQTARQVIQSGALGEVTSVRIRGAHDGLSGGWLPEAMVSRRECGVFSELGFPPLYLSRYLLGRRPQQVTGFAGCRSRPGVEDNGAYVLSFMDGAYVLGEASYHSAHAPFCLEVYGTGGALCCGGAHGGILCSSGGQWEQLTPAPALPPPEQNWVDAAAGLQAPAFGLEDGLYESWCLERLYESCRLQKTIPLGKKESK